MAVKHKTPIVIYEQSDTLPQIDKLARLHKISRAELYRRAMRLMLAKCRNELQEALSDAS